MKIESILVGLSPEIFLNLKNEDKIKILEFTFKEKSFGLTNPNDFVNNIIKLLKQYNEKNLVFDYLINVLNKENDETLINRLMDILIITSSKPYIHEYLVDILNSDNLKLKLPIYYSKCFYPIRRIIQSKEFRNSIVAFINSIEFQVEFERRKNFPGYHSELYAFPSQYKNAFQIKDFDNDLIEGISKNKMLKLVTQERLESIRLIKCENTQLRLLWMYYSQYLPKLYKTKFVKIVDDEFPHLKELRNKNKKYFFYGC